MRRIRAFWIRFAGVFHSREAELQTEIESHLEFHIADNLRAGMSPEQARREALLRLGGIEVVKEAYRERQSLPVFEHLLQDLRYAFRQIRRSPGFASVVVLSLALGIGANTAIFSIVHALLLRALPVDHPEQLFLIHQQVRTTYPVRFSYPMFERLRDARSGALGVAAISRITGARVMIGRASQPEIVPVQLVSGEFFPVLGVPAALGRVLAPEDDRTANPAAVISYRFWESRLAGSHDVIGRKLTINGAAFTIIGIAPQGFSGVWVDSLTDIWVPTTLQHTIHYSQNFSGHNNSRPEESWISQDMIDWLDVIVRAPPSSAGAVRQSLNAVFLRSIDTVTAGFGTEVRRFFLERSLSFETFGRGLSFLRERFTAPLLALMGLVALVLLIACANTANLLLARSEGRRREIAVRLSIGAGRGRLLQQLLVESFLLVALGAAIGVALAPRASDLLVRATLGVTQGATPLAVHLDRGVLLFTLALSVLTGLLFGLAPALRATQTDLSGALKTASRQVAAAPLTPARLLVAAQIALSLLVVFGAGLFARSLWNLAHTDLGFDREHVLTVWISPRIAGYEGERLAALYPRLIERAAAVPGVRSAAVSMCGLVAECRSSRSDLRVEGYEPAPREEMGLQYSFVSPGYFSTVGMSLASGRDFDARDRGNRRAIVNQAFVRRYLSRANPIGRHFGNRLESEIIGLVQDARVNRVREAAVPMAYFPLQGNLVYAESLEVRAAGDPTAIARDVRQAIAAAAPDLPIQRVTTMPELIDRSLNQERLIGFLAAAFGLLALGLACFGIYGVMAYTVTRHTNEIGIRMALGAQPARILYTVLRQAVLMTIIGLGLALPLLLIGSRAVGSLLYQVTPVDPATLAAAIAILLVVALSVGLVPAWRAARLNPVQALRHD